MKNWMSSRNDDRLVHMTNVAMEVLGDKIQEIVNNEQKLHQTLCYLYGSVTSEHGFDHSHVVNCVSDLVQSLVNSPQLNHIQTTELENLAIELLHKSRYKTTAVTRIKAAVENIDIQSVITVFSDMLDKFNISTIEPRKRVDANLCDDVEMLETANKVLSSACSDAIRSLIESRIEKSLVYDSHRKTARCLYSPINAKLTATRDINQRLTRVPKKKKASSSDASRRLTEMYSDLKEKRDLHARLIAEARLISECEKFTITIVDVDGKAITQIHSPEESKTIEIEYVPPCSTYPTSHYDAYSVNREKYDSFDETYKEIYKNRKRYPRKHPELFLALDIFNNTSSNKITDHIRAYPRHFGELLVIEHCASQLKRGRALLRLDMNHPTRQMNQGEYVELDSSQHFSCIKQALKSENVSQLAKVLAEYESETRSTQVASPETEFMTSHVPRDACKSFQSTGSSVEAEVYRQLGVERIIDGDITTALKLCCIGHQIRLCRDMINPISDAQTLGDTFEQMLKMESYEQERSKFLSICDELMVQSS